MNIHFQPRTLYLSLVEHFLRFVGSRNFLLECCDMSLHWLQLPGTDGRSKQPVLAFTQTTTDPSIQF